MDLGALPKPIICTRETVCDSDTDDTNLIGYSINKTDMFYINNWVEQLNMYCTPKIYTGYMGAFAFLGAALACFFLPLCSDLYGRKYVFILSCASQIPMYVLANKTSSLGVIYFCVFFLGVALIGRFACGFVLMTECLQKKH